MNYSIDWDGPGERDHEQPEDPVFVVAEQARDDGLWFVAETAAEAYLQQALRRLHAAVECKTPEQCAREALYGGD